MLDTGKKIKKLYISLSLILLVIVLSSCGRNANDESIDYIVVTTSWLECCVRDIAGSETGIIRLCPPGTCPGHFDLTPGAVKSIKDSRLVFRFDFQSSLDDKLAGNGARVMVIDAPEGLCVPSGYLSSCRGICKALKEINPGKTEFYNRRLIRADTQLSRLEEEIRRKIGAHDLTGVKVIASGHQAAFCRWLGLETVASYSGPQSATPRDLENIVQNGKDAGVLYVIANLQEGRQVGEALAYHLGARLVEFSNFPDMSAGQNSFEALVLENVNRLVEAARENNAAK
jgi:ABC-type Zn uptake system ZnuABC Zn-binding protein ZnuA